MELNEEVEWQTEIRTTLCSSCITLGHFPEEVYVNIHHEDTYVLMLSVLLLIVAKIREQSRYPSIDECIVYGTNDIT